MSVEKKHVWHGQQEKILKEWSEISSSYRFMHDRAHGKFHSQNLSFTLPVIILSTITGTANFAHEAFPDSWKDYVPLGIGFLNLTAGLITTIAQFLRVSEKMEGHRAASISYSKLARNIAVELSLPVSERTIDGSAFIMECRTQLDRLLEQSPDLDDSTINKFEKKFRKHKFHKPAIIDLRSVDVYKDDELENARKKREILEQDFEHRKRIIAEEQKFRQDIIHKEKLAHKQSILEMKQLKDKKRANKLKNITASDIGNRMTKLLGHIENQRDANLAITISSSDDDSPNGSDTIESEITSTTENVVIEIMDASNNSI